MTRQPCPRATEVGAPGLPEADGIPAFHREPDIVVYHAHAVDVLARLPGHSVHCVITAPQYGREATLTVHIDRLREVFTHLARVLVADGTVWLNLADPDATYSDADPRSHPGGPRQPGFPPSAGVPVGNLLGMPWRVAFALQADGWIVRNAAVCHTPSTTPSPVGDRLSSRYEWLFLLTRAQRYFFDLDAIRVPYTGDRSLSRRTHRAGRKPHTARGSWPPSIRQGQPVPGRNPGDVWTITSRGEPRPRPEFPITLPLRAISAGCPAHGVVLDPFAGSGTTLLAARQLARHAIGIDPDERSCEITARRLADTAGHHRITRHGQEPASAGRASADPPPRQRSRNETP